MIKILLSLLLIILVLVFFWKNILLTDKKKVKFDNKLETYVSPTFAQPNNKNNNVEKLRKVYKQVNPSNFYTQNYNTPNFTTNVEDLRKFFAYDVPPNNTDKTLNIPTQPFKENFNNQNSIGSNDMIQQEKVDNYPWYIKEKNTPSGLEYESDYWVYNNEMPMNGGLFGKIVGYENMGDSFSQFYNKNSMDIVQEQERFIKKDDDLRNGMGTPQKQKYLYNMSNP